MIIWEYKTSILLDLTVAFDKVDREVLLFRLDRTFGIRGVTLN